MKFKVAISIDEGPLPFVVHVAVPEGFEEFKAAKFRFKRVEDAMALQGEYLNEFLNERKTIMRFHLRKIRELHGEPYLRED